MLCNFKHRNNAHVFAPALLQKNPSLRRSPEKLMFHKIVWEPKGQVRFAELRVSLLLPN